mmetsp:Transcript_8165/g.30117  ORF Transcript_8165/g.30117 Transcript_8165/m.30117 type:complete len:268 (+) Transcript_8165:527-1330(+)
MVHAGHRADARSARVAGTGTICSLGCLLDLLVDDVLHVRLPCALAQGCAAVPHALAQPPHLPPLPGSGARVGYPAFALEEEAQRLAPRLHERHGAGLRCGVRVPLPATPSPAAAACLSRAAVALRPALVQYGHASLPAVQLSRGSHLLQARGPTYLRRLDRRQPGSAVRAARRQWVPCRPGGLRPHGPYALLLLRGQSQPPFHGTRPIQGRRACHDDGRARAWRYACARVGSRRGRSAARLGWVDRDAARREHVMGRLLCDVVHRWS